MVKRLFSILLIFGLVLGLTACSKDEVPEEIQAAEETTLTGTWYMVGVDEPGLTEEEKEDAFYGIALMKLAGMEVTLVLEKNGTGIYNFYDSYNIIYDTDTNILKLVEGEETSDPINFEFTGTQLLLINNDSKLIFSKSPITLTPEQEAYMEEMLTQQ